MTARHEPSPESSDVRLRDGEGACRSRTDRRRVRSTAPSVLVGVAVGTAMLTMPSACSRGDDVVRLEVAPSLIFPKALLDDVARLTITVYEAGLVSCSERSGEGAIGDRSTPVATSNLNGTSCGPGIRFCGTLILDRTADERVFLAEGFDAASNVKAVGCTQTRIDQATLPLEIRMQRFAAPAVCGNGFVEPTEQCEPPGGDNDPLCDAECHSKEILLSGGRGTGGTTGPGKPGDKTSPAFLWPSGTGGAGRFVAAFTDRALIPSEVTMRVLSDALTPWDGQGTEMRDYSFFMPNDPLAGFPPSVEANRQNNPVLAAVAQRYFVVFEDDSGGTTDIRLRSLDQNFAAEQNPQAALVINGVTGEPGEQKLPTVAAGANGLLFVAWQNDAAGSIAGRTFDPATSTLGETQILSSGSSNKNVVVAAVGPAGWVAVWESGGDVKWRAIGADGVAQSSDQTVNESSHAGSQTHPWVAGTNDGRFAVVWNDRGSSAGDVFVQRFDDRGRKVAGDQLDRVNDVGFEGDQGLPVIASTGTDFVVAWVDNVSGHVRARYLGGDGGFLFNNVDAQTSEFAASVEPRRRRGHPAVAFGGAGPFVAIGWEDLTTDSRAGIYVRRFPAPSR